MFLKFELASLFFTEDKGPAYPSIVAFESSSLKIEFNFTKQPENPQTTDIVANFTNLSPNVYTDFLFQAAVPKVRSQTCFFCVCGISLSLHSLYQTIFPKQKAAMGLGSWLKRSTISWP